MTTSAQRDENRLGELDRLRIFERVTEYATISRQVMPADRFTTAVRLAHHAIGCTEHDLRVSELTDIECMVRLVLARQ